MDTQFKIEDRKKGDTFSSVLAEYDGLDLNDAVSIVGTFRQGKVRGLAVKEISIGNGLTINSSAILQIDSFECNFNNGTYFLDIRIETALKKMTHLRIIFNVNDTTND